MDGPTVVLTVQGEDDGPSEKAQFRQPLGLRARPRPNTANANIAQDGDFPEVLLAWTPELNLPSIAEGESQLHSLGQSPKIVSVTDSAIKLGQNANKGVARLDDQVDCGYLAITPGPMGISSVAWLPPGTLPLPVPPVIVISMTGKIKTASTVTSSE